MQLDWAGFEFATLVVIDTDRTGSCKSNYHTITTTMASDLKSNYHINTLHKIAEFEFYFNNYNFSEFMNHYFQIIDYSFIFVS